MSDDEFEEEAELDDEDLDEDALDEDDDEVLDTDLDDDAEEVLVDDATDVEADETVEPEAAAPVRPAKTDDEDDDVVDLDEELHPDDVEEALDVVLRERTVAAGLEDEDDEEDEADDRGEGSVKIMPRRPGEFLCSSCFLVLPRHQLADEKRMLCRDCA